MCKVISEIKQRTCVHMSGKKPYKFCVKITMHYYIFGVEVTPCTYNVVIEMVVVSVFVVISRLDVIAGDIRVWR